MVLVRPNMRPKFLLWWLPLVLIFHQFNPGSVTLFVESALGNVIEEGEFVIVRTHDSGTFVGIKQYIQLDTDQTGDAAAIDPTEAVQEPEINEGEPRLENKRVYYAFKGVPYAAKPLGSFRWKEPQAYDVKDSGPKDSTKYQSVCSQWDSHTGEVVGSQDCLYLNIFTPRLFFSTPRPLHSNQVNYSKFDDDPRETKRHLPVLLYVHDGDFISGSGNLAPGAEQAFMKQDIILVTFSYRLGVFGYLSSGTRSLSGNYGLLDQITVLKWLHKNVHRFGGNSNRITVFGNTLFLQVSPLASGLFHNVILMQSTTTLASPPSTVLNMNPQDYFTRFAAAANCSVTGEILQPENDDILEDMLNDCLRLKPPVDLIRVQQSFYKFWRFPKLLTPTIDEGLNEVGDVLPNSVLDMLSNLGIPQESQSGIEPPPIMMGVSAKGEGVELFHDFYRSVSAEDAFISSNRLGIRKLLRAKLRRYLEQIIIKDVANNPKTFNGIWSYYFDAVQFIPDSSEIPELFWSQLLQLFGDVTVYVPYWTLLKNMRQTESLKLFNYVFDPEPSTELSAPENPGGDSTFHKMPMEEEFYLFPKPKSLTSSQASTPELNQNRNEELSDVMVNIWVSFAAYENPKNAITKHKDWGRWTKFGYNYNKLNQTMYYHIKQDVSQMQDNFKKQEAQFWLETLPQLCELSSTAEELEDWPTLFWIFISLTCVLFLIVVAILGYMFWTKYSEKY